MPNATKTEKAAQKIFIKKTDGAHNEQPSEKFEKRKSASKTKHLEGGQAASNSGIAEMLSAGFEEAKLAMPDVTLCFPFEKRFPFSKHHSRGQENDLSCLYAPKV